MTDTTTADQHLTSKPTDDVRSSLVAESERLTGQLQAIQSETVNLRADRVGHDSMDDGTAQTDTDQAGQVAASLQERLDQTNAAIKRFDDGTYGTCESCGQSINPGRLEVRPTATACIDCA